MIDFTSEEMKLMMIYSPGFRSGLIKELTQMKGQLTASERRLSRLVDSTILKLECLTDEEFDKLSLYPDF